jgi:Fe-S cluster assembly protein SufD
MGARFEPNEVEKAIAAEFPLRLLTLPGDAALKQRRKQAMAHFEAVGLPGRRDEAWHYTDLRNMMHRPAVGSLEPMAQIGEEPQGEVGRLAVDHLRVTKGRLLSGHPLPEGVRIYTLASAMAERPDLVARIGEAVPDLASPVVAINTAFFPDVTIIHVDKGVSVDVPLHAAFAYQHGTPVYTDARALIILEDGASATMINSVETTDETAYQTNAVIELLIGDDAKLSYIRSNTGGAQSMALHTIGAKLGARAELNLFCMNAGSALGRTELRVAFAGEHSKAGLRGVSLLRGEQHGDITLVVDHIAPHCESRELFRSIVDQSATGIFQGRINVRPGAQKTDGQMASNAILLSDDAVMNNKPELEIFADDVVCAHGATCGALDDDLLFYLEARGLPRAEAEALMIQAFCGEAIEFVEHEPLRDALNATVAQWLASRAGA